MRRLSRKTLATEYDVSTRTVDRRLKEIEALPDRYPKDAILRGATVRIRADVARDYMELRNQIREGTAPPFEGGKGLCQQ